MPRDNAAQAGVVGGGGRERQRTVAATLFTSYFSIFAASGFCWKYGHQAICSACLGQLRRHVARAQAEHQHLASLRARAFPTTVVTGRKFDAKRARRKARKLTTGYRKQVKRVRSKRRARRVSARQATVGVLRGRFR